MITRKDILNHLERGVRTDFLVGMKGYTPRRAPFCKDNTSDGAFETYVALGASPWPVGNAGKTGSAGTDADTGAQITGRMNSGRQITVVGTEEQAIKVVNLDWEIAIGVTHNAINDDRTNELTDWARSAGQNFQKHMDYLAFQMLETGDVGTYGLCYDGQYFFDSDHKDPGAEYQTNQDNDFDSSLSLDNFTTVKIACAKFLDSRGQPAGLTHDLLVVPVDLEYTAAQICQNMEAYDTASREKNPYAGVMKYIVAPGAWLASTAWFLVATGEVQKPVGMQMRQQPELTQWDDENAGDGGVRYYKWHARYAPYYGDWRLAGMGNT